MGWRRVVGGRAWWSRHGGGLSPRYRRCSDFSSGCGGGLRGQRLGRFLPNRVRGGTAVSLLVLMLWLPLPVLLLVAFLVVVVLLSLSVSHRRWCFCCCCCRRRERRTMPESRLGAESVVWRPYRPPCVREVGGVLPLQAFDEYVFFAGVLLQDGVEARNPLRVVDAVEPHQSLRASRGQSETRSSLPCLLT